MKQVVASVLAGVAFIAVVLAVRLSTKTVEKVVDAHRAPVTAMLAKVKALPPRVQAVPPIAAQATSPIPGLMLVRMGSGNAILVHERDLANPANIAHTPELPRIASELFTCHNDLSATSTGQFAPPVGPLEATLETCANVKYILVMRTHKRRMAQLLNGDTFLGGSIDGDVLVFTPAGNYYGGFPWHAQSSDTVSVRMDATQRDMEFALDLHMRDKVERAILDGLNRAFPGSAW